MQGQIKKPERKNVQNSLSYGRKTNFSAILKIAAIIKTCLKNFPILLNFEAVMFTQNVAKDKNIRKYAFFL
jgi:hypothetical protein